MLYLMIGTRNNKCTRTLMTAFTSQINGGKAMTPGLSNGCSVFNGERLCVVIVSFLVYKSTAVCCWPCVRRRVFGSADHQEVTL
jgi:hypothetical protein